MHRTLKRKATIPPAISPAAQQRQFDAFRHQVSARPRRGPPRTSRRLVPEACGSFLLPGTRNPVTCAWRHCLPSRSTSSQAGLVECRTVLECSLDERCHLPWSSTSPCACSSTRSSFDPSGAHSAMRLGECRSWPNRPATTQSGPPQTATGDLPLSSGGSLVIKAPARQWRAPR